MADQNTYKFIRDAKSHIKNHGLPTKRIEHLSFEASQAYTAFMKYQNEGNMECAVDIVTPYYFELFFNPESKVQSMALVAQSIQKYDAKKILDMGCGNGILTCFMAERYPNKELVGTDISRVAIDIATRRSTEYRQQNIIFGVVPHLQLAEIYGPDVFDFIFAEGSLTDYDEPEEFKVVNTILKNNGIFVNFFSSEDMTLHKKLLGENAGLTFISNNTLCRVGDYGLFSIVFKK